MGDSPAHDTTHRGNGGEAPNACDQGALQVHEANQRVTFLNVHISRYSPGSRLRAFTLGSARISVPAIHA